MRVLVTFFVLGLSFMILYNPGFAQSDTAHIRIQSGGSVNFKYNSLYDYEEGKIYDQWTTFNIYADFSSATYWRLRFKSLTTEIRGEYDFDNDGQYTIPLSKVKLKATVTSDGNSTGEKTLSSSYKDLVTEGTQGTNVTVTIQYQCDSLLGFDPDYYFVDIEFKIAPQ